MTQPCERSESTFRLEYVISRDISAAPDAVWAILTDADRFAEWNSTVSSLEGRIAPGEKLTLRVPIAPDRAFTPKVTELNAPKHMVWSDGFFPMFQGTRTFTLTPTPTGTRFTMVEVFRGMMLPMIKGSLPDFREPFEHFARDLASAAESA